jgi:hypothetical protein
MENVSLRDATTPDTLAPSHISATSLLAGSAANHSSNLKHQKYSSLQPEYLFVPVAIETLGPWNTEGLKFIEELGRRTSALTGEPRETVFLKQRLSVAVQKGNALSCRGTLPDSDWSLT